MRSLNLDEMPTVKKAAELRKEKKLRKSRIVLVGIAGVFLLGAALMATATNVSAAGEESDFGQCIAMMAKSGPNDHAAMMGFDNFGQVVLHCQTMHDPPPAR